MNNILHFFLGKNENEQTAHLRMCLYGIFHQFTLCPKGPIGAGGERGKGGNKGGDPGCHTGTTRNKGGRGDYFHLEFTGF